jgi:hypothetical protein
MLFQATKAPSVPLIQSSRLTCIGMQYMVADPDIFHVVTVTNTNIICCCGIASCPHIAVVQAEYARHIASDTQRTTYTALFDLSYGD